MKQMKCQKCGEETVYVTDNFNLPFGCRKCNHQFSVKGVMPKNSNGIPIWNNDGTLNPDGKETAEGSITTESIPVVRVVSAAPVKDGLRFPDGEFSQKELAAFNGFDNYKVVYSDLQKLLAKGILVRGSKRESTHGKPAQLFKVAQSACAVKA